MSGVEVIGLTLGVLPLIISAVENYEVTFRPFVTYCRCCKELRDFRTAFATQKHLFESHCLVLFCRVGAEWLAEESPENWKDGGLKDQEVALEEKITEYLGGSLKPCIPLIECIAGTVLGIQEEAKCLNGVDSEVS